MNRLILLLLICAFSALSQEVVFRGVPTSRVFSSPERDDRLPIDAEAAKKAECVIVQRGKNKYFWASRDNAPVNRIDTPQFTYFVHSAGLGYVKVYTGERSANTATVEYVESITRGFDVITYWGKVATEGK